MILNDEKGKMVYSDGTAVEQEMMEVASTYPEDLSQDYISKSSKYTINNTFSSVRRNILNWYPFRKDSEILEVGAGMGSITGLLCDVAKHVTSIEMSEARAAVIKARYPQRENLTIISEDINLWKTSKRFDYVVFIGVLEYAAMFSDAENPFELFLTNVKNLLKPDGVVLFAIENRFGLKYWAGGSEDHLVKPFVGIEGYKEKNTPRTFSKAELEKMLINTGLKKYRFYYVLPDYKFPEIICTDEYKPDYSVLQKVPFTYSKNSILLFNEKDIYKDILENEKLDFFANSYLVEATTENLPEYHALYISAKSEVKKKYRVSTVIDSNQHVYKMPMHEDAKAHLNNIKEIERELNECGVEILQNHWDGDRIYTNFFNGEGAQDRFAKLIADNDAQGLHDLISMLREALKKSSRRSFSKRTIFDWAGISSELYIKDMFVLEKGYIDMTFYNAFIEKDKLLFYDQEWCFDNVPLEYILYYAIKSAYNRINLVTQLSLHDILKMENLLKYSEVFDKIEDYIWSTVMYRMGDLYGEDGYCNRYDKEKSINTLWKNIEQELKNAVEQKEEYHRGLLDAQEQMNALNIELGNKRNELIDIKKTLECKNAHVEQLLQSERELKQDVMNKTGHIEQLLQSERELKQEIENFMKSRTWRVANVLHKPILWLVPLGSKRRLFVKMACKFLRHPVRMIKMLSPRKIRHFFHFLREEGPEFVSNRIDESIQGVSIKKMELEIEECIPQKRFEEYECLEFVSELNPLVSIIIPVYNEFAYTYGCLKSILENTNEGIPYEIIIADDCSTDNTIRLHEIVSNVNIIRNKKNLRFLKNCNNAAKKARGKYLFFLNNDTQVQKNWLHPLISLIQNDESIGMVGSKLIYADGLLQEAGGIIWKDASAWNYGNRQNPEQPEFNYVKEVDYISGAAIMIRTSLWKEIGGFDENLAPAYCEDSDLAFQVRKHGYKVFFQPLSVVMHFEGISNGTDTNEGQKSYQITNQKKFYEKWKDELKDNHFENGTNVFLARDRSRNKKHILVIDHYVPQYDKDAGSKTIFMYLKMFIKMGYKVTFLGDNFYKHEPYTEQLQQMGIFVLYGPDYAKNWQDWLDRNVQYFDVFFLNRPHITVKYIDFIKKRAHGKIIYYGHDLHYLRTRREYELNGKKELLLESEEWKKQEYDIMHKADMNYYPSIVEEQEIHNMDKNIPVKAITAYVYESFKQISYHIDDRNGILFVGGFGHGPNIDAVLWFLEHVYPEVFKCTHAPFYIVGSNAPEQITSITTEGVIVKGFVSEKELEELYQNCRMAIVPLRYGAGVKGKVVEALYYGIPIVTTSVGAEGIEGLSEIAVIEDDADKLIESICEIYMDEERLVAMSEKSQDFIRKKFSIQAVWDILKDDFQ